VRGPLPRPDPLERSLRVSADPLGDDSTDDGAPALTVGRCRAAALTGATENRVTRPSPSPYTHHASHTAPDGPVRVT
jgi:hypothetical protein